MDPTTEQCKNCVTFAEPDPTSRRVTKPPCLENVHDSTYTRDYPGHKRISPPLSRKPQDALPIVTDYKTQYVTTCQERFRPWNMKTIPRYENKAPRNKWASPEVSPVDIFTRCQDPNLCTITHCSPHQMCQDMSDTLYHVNILVSCCFDTPYSSLSFLKDFPNRS